MFCVEVRDRWNAIIRELAVIEQEGMPPLPLDMIISTYEACAAAHEAALLARNAARHAQAEEDNARVKEEEED